MPLQWPLSLCRRQCLCLNALLKFRIRACERVHQASTFSAPCRIRALLHPAPLLLLVIVVTLSARLWSAYPLYISALVFWRRRPLYFLHISPYSKRAALRSPSDGTIISHKSCCIVLTFMGRYDLSVFPRLAVPGPLPNPATHASAVLSFPSTRF